MAHAIILFIIYVLPSLIKCIIGEEKSVDKPYFWNEDTFTSSKSKTRSSSAFDNNENYQNSENDEDLEHKHNILKDLKEALKKAKEDVKKQIMQTEFVKSAVKFDSLDRELTENLKNVEKTPITLNHVKTKSGSIKEKEGPSDSDDIQKKNEVKNGNDAYRNEAVPQEGEKDVTKQCSDDKNIKTNEPVIFFEENNPVNLVDSKGFLMLDTKTPHSEANNSKRKRQSIFFSDIESADLYTIAPKNTLESPTTPNDFYSYWKLIHGTKLKHSLLIANESLDPSVTSSLQEKLEKKKDIASETQTEGIRSHDQTEIKVDENEVLPEKESETKDQLETLETYSQFAERVSAEKKNGANSLPGHGSNGQVMKGPKVKSKNYASPDCGAKLLASNPEASNSHKIVHSDKDEYMLNKCSDKIWAIIDLCESIRPHKFDIANFELFSNLPKDIQLYGSHRYPTRDWISLGLYKGEEGNRDVQSFSIEAEEFFKYIKIEVLSNYGTEFFCPVSLFRIYGLSEFEVIDQLEEVEDIATDEEVEIEEMESSQEKVKEKPGMIPNILKSMLSGVLEVIKRGSRSSNDSDEPEQFNIYTESCISLHVNFAIPNDSCPIAHSLNYILACYSEEYQKLMQHPFLASAVQNLYFCSSLVNMSCSSAGINDTVVYDTVCNNSYACVMLSPKHILAMCYMQHPAILYEFKNCNAGADLSSSSNSTYASNTLDDEENDSVSFDVPIKNKSIGRKKLKDDEALHNLVPPDGSANVSSTIHASFSQVEAENHVNASTEHRLPPHTIKENQRREKLIKPIALDANVVFQIEEPFKTNGETSKGGKLDKESLSKTNSTTDETISSQPGSASTPPLPLTISTAATSGENRVVSTSANKESIVVRLSNKIKVLEQNMSISSQYLEELSRRYKRQMEEMEHQFNITIMALNETSQTAYERDLHHQKYIESLELELVDLKKLVHSLASERDNFLSTIIEQHLILFVIEVIILCLAFIFCIRRRHAAELKSPPLVMQINGSLRNSSQSDIQSTELSESFINVEKETLPNGRRRSVDSIQRANESKVTKRRMSDDIQNVSGSYEHLLIPSVSASNSEEGSKERRKKRCKNSLKRSASNSSLHEKVRSHSIGLSKKEKKKREKMKRSSAGDLFSVERILQRPGRIEKVQELKPLDSEEGWSKVQSRKMSRVKNEDFYVEQSYPNHKLRNEVGSINQYTYSELNAYEEVIPFEVGIHLEETLTANQVFAAPELDYNAPAVKYYYQDSEDTATTYPPFNTADLDVDDQLTPIWSADPSARSLTKANAMSEFSKIIPSCSSPIRGKTKLRADNWHWYSSQPQELALDSNLSTASEVISPTDDWVVKGKMTKTEKRKKKKKSSKL